MPLKKQTLLLAAFLLSFSDLVQGNGSDLPAEKIEQSLSQAPPSFCYFLPPEGWDIADPQHLSPRIQIAFIKKKSEGFRPSLNLAIENVEIGQAEYIKAVKNIHESDRGNRWRPLGKVHTSAGLADLTEIDTMTEWGSVRMLQLILVKQGKAYVLTAAALKKEIPLLYKSFQTSFRSLQVTDDLVACIPQMERRESLKKAEEKLLNAWEKNFGVKEESLDADLSVTRSQSEADRELPAIEEKQPPLLSAPFQEEDWIPFQNRIIDDFKDMGVCWQVLLLKSIQEKLLSYQFPETLSIGEQQNEKK